MSIAIREVAAIHDGKELCRRYGRVIAENRDVTDLTVPEIHGTMITSEDVESITYRNWQRGNVRRACRTNRRKAKERRRQRQLDIIAVIGIIGLFVLALGIGTFLPSAKLLLVFDFIGIAVILRRWLQ